MMGKYFNYKNICVTSQIQEKIIKNLYGECLFKVFCKKKNKEKKEKNT